MKHYLLAAALLVATFALGRPVPLLSQALERSMWVTVVDQSGAPVADLGPSDFIVREDNVAREVLRVAPATDPMQVAVMVDTSTAAGPLVPHIRRALPPFFATLTAPTASGRHNEVALITLGSRPTIVVEYSTALEPLEKGAERIWEDSVPTGYYLLNGIIEVTQGFRRREAARPVIVAIVSEGIELSDRHPDQVLTPLRDSGAAFHVISIGTPAVDVSDEVRFRNTVVDQGPGLSGGTRTHLLAGSALPNQLQQLGNRLTHAYRVTYARPVSLIPPEHVTVAARRAGLTANGTPVREPQAKR